MHLLCLIFVFLFYINIECKPASIATNPEEGMSIQSKNNAYDLMLGFYNVAYL
jgi:hypothetical protein